jgi:hypothetical protein
LFAKNRVEVPCQSAFYRLQKRAALLIIDEVMSSCKCVREEMNADSCLGFDGSWSCCRHAMHCFILFSDVTQNACCDFIIISKVPGRDTGHQGSYQAMETEWLDILALKWKDADSGMPAISRFIHGNDSHASHLLKTIDWQLDEFIDPNHGRKGIMREFQKRFSIFPDYMTLAGKNQQWFQVLIKLKLTPEQPQSQWMNTINDLHGDQSKCLHYWTSVKSRALWKGVSSSNGIALLTEFTEKGQNHSKSGWPIYNKFY